MASLQDFDKLDEKPAGPATIMIGVPEYSGMAVDLENEQLRWHGNTIGANTTRFSNQVLVKNTDSVKAQLFGGPITVSDNPSGLIPSTLFTQTPAFIPSIDEELLELQNLISALGGI